jgi:hypothetical protein
VYPAFTPLQPSGRPEGTRNEIPAEVGRTVPLSRADSTGREGALSKKKDKKKDKKKKKKGKKKK